MKYHKQTIKHNPAIGQYGDCFRTCVACLLDLEVDQVPHFCENGGKNAASEMDAWLIHNYGLYLFAVPFENGTLESVLAAVARNNPGPYLLVGESSNHCNHCVICQGDKVIHNPNPNSEIIGATLEGYWWIEVLALIDPTR